MWPRRWNCARTSNPGYESSNLSGASMFGNVVFNGLAPLPLKQISVGSNPTGPTKYYTNRVLTLDG